MRQVLALVLVAALAIGGFQGVRAYRDHQAAQQAEQQRQAELQRQEQARAAARAAATEPLRQATVRAVALFSVARPNETFQQYFASLATADTELEKVAFDLEAKVFAEPAKSAIQAPAVAYVRAVRDALRVEERYWRRRMVADASLQGIVRMAESLRRFPGDADYQRIVLRSFAAAPADITPFLDVLQQRTDARKALAEAAAAVAAAVPGPAVDAAAASSWLAAAQAGQSQEAQEFQSVLAEIRKLVPSQPG